PFVTCRSQTARCWPRSCATMTCAWPRATWCCAPAIDCCLPASMQRSPTSKRCCHDATPEGADARVSATPVRVAHAAPSRASLRALVIDDQLAPRLAGLADALGLAEPRERKAAIEADIEHAAIDQLRESDQRA